MILLYQHIHTTNPHDPGKHIFVLFLSLAIICLPGFIVGLYRKVKRKVSFMSVDIGMFAFTSTFGLIIMCVMILVFLIFNFLIRIV